MCGIFGFAGKLGNHEFNVLKFATLGAINDSRGGDSAGAFIDGKDAYGIGDEKLFIDFASKNKFLRDYKGVSVQHALGHCRKASVGAKTIREAQPVCVSMREDKETELVMIHNGTLLNHDELSKKYLRDVPDYFTDSQIFANVVYHFGFNVLEEYFGAGAFAFIDYRKKVPTTYLFKGESKQYVSSTTCTEERPLYWVRKEEGIWFSSIKESLELISLGEDVVEPVPSNTLIMIQNGKVISTRKYNRSKKWQMGSRNFNEDWYSNSYGYQNRNTTPSTPTVPKKDRIYTPYTAALTTHKAISLVADEREATYDTEASNKIIFRVPEGRYYRGGELLDGEHYISEYGFMNSYTSVQYNMVMPPKKFYFFDGYLMKDALCYEIAKAVKEKAGEKFRYKMLMKLTMTCFYDADSHKFYTRKGKSYTGDYPIFFTLSNRIYKIKNGYVDGYTEAYSSAHSTVWKNYTPQYSGKDVGTKFASLVNKSTKKILSTYNIQ